jgi:hypothetical protein
MQQATREAFLDITGGPMSRPGRVSLSNVAAWVPVQPSSSDLSSINVSVVFEPNPSESIDVTVETVREPAREEPPISASQVVTASMIEEVAPVTDSMFEESPVEAPAVPPPRRPKA